MAERRTVARDEDPVCGMTLDPEAGRAEGLAIKHEGIDNLFCGRACLQEFRDDPDTYLTPDYVLSL